MKKRIHIPRRMGGFNDIYWHLARHLPGTPKGYSILALILFAVALFLPCIDRGGPEPLRGLECMRIGWAAIKYATWTHKVLFASWASSLYMIYSMVTLGSSNAYAKPELFSIILLLAFAAIYILSNTPLDLDAEAVPPKVMNGAWVWVSAQFCAFMAHTKLAYD